MPEPAAIRAWWAGSARSGVNRPDGGCTAIRSPGRNLVGQPARHDAVLNLAYAYAQRRAGGRADRVRAALVAALHRHRLAGPEGEGLAQVIGHGEGDRRGVVGEPVDARDGELVESRGHRGLTCSNGSAHAAAPVASDLQAVALEGALCGRCRSSRTAGHATESGRVVSVSATARARRRLRRRDVLPR